VEYAWNETGTSLEYIYNLRAPRSSPNRPRVPNECLTKLVGGPPQQNGSFKLPQQAWKKHGINMEQVGTTAE